MPSWLVSFLAFLRDLAAIWRRSQEQLERSQLKAEAKTETLVAVEIEQLNQQKETRDVMDHAVSDLPDRASASQRLRDGRF